MKEPVIQAIHTVVPGRARYKVAGLYRSAVLGRLLERQLSRIKGINSVSANPLTGKVLVFFNSDKSAANIAALIVEVVGMRDAHSAERCPVSRLSDRERNDLEEQEGARDRQETQLGLTTAAQRRAVRKLVVHAKTPEQKPWHLVTPEVVLASWRTSPASGLSSQTARDHLLTYGPNLLPESVPRSELGIFADQLNSLPVAMLTVAAGVSLFTGGLADAVVILGVVAMNAIIGYVTESRSEKTIYSLKHLVRPSAVVVRDGKPQEVPADAVVPGDVLVLKPGSYVSADSRLIEAERLSVDESTLTGESLPVSKTADMLTNPDLPLADRVNMVYMGTLVTGGQGSAVVVATGRFTEIGRIQELAGEAQTPETPMQRQLSQMGTQLAVLCGGVCTLVFGIGVLRGYGLLAMLKNSVSLAVAAVPEGLPTVATTTLALGILNMRRHHVLIRRLDAVETLGCVQTICLDKTGTLTLNKMSVVVAYVGLRRIEITDGHFRAGEDMIEPLTCEELARLGQVCTLCSETEIERHDGQYLLQGSPTENALIHMAIRAGVDAVRLREEYPVLHASLRAENRNFMSTVHRAPCDHTDKGASRAFIAVKGSPAEVLAMCAWQMNDGVQAPLTEEDRLRIETENDRMAGEALRILGVAYGDGAEEGKEAEILGGLTWLGLVGMADPVRTGVKNVIAGFHRAGIDTVMITGDQSPTAYAIGKELTLNRNGTLEILDSSHLTHVDPEVLKALANKVQIFARVSPAHKLQIVQALQHAGKVVAMTGDGINDGPALKAADIGIAMGNTGTDVAREVADVVLEDDNLETMLVAVSQGRTIYRNIRKSVHYLLSTNLSEIILMFTAVSAGVGQPLNAMQLLWINLLSDIAPGLALALEPPEPDVLEQPPRSAEEPIITSSDLRRVSLESATLAAGAMGAYGYGMLRYGVGPQASTLAFTSLTVGELLHALSCRSETRNVFTEAALPPNPYLNTALMGSFLLQGLAFVIPGLRSLLGISLISLIDGLVIGGGAILPLIVNEATKRGDARTTRKAMSADH